MRMRRFTRRSLAGYFARGYSGSVVLFQCRKPVETIDLVPHTDHMHAPALVPYFNVAGGCLLVPDERQVEDDVDRGRRGRDHVTPPFRLCEEVSSMNLGTRFACCFAWSRCIRQVVDRGHRGVHGEQRAPEHRDQEPRGRADSSYQNANTPD